MILYHFLLFLPQPSHGQFLFWALSNFYTCLFGSPFLLSTRAYMKVAFTSISWFLTLWYSMPLMSSIIFLSWATSKSSTPWMKIRENLDCYIVILNFMVLISNCTSSNWNFTLVPLFLSTSRVDTLFSSDCFLMLRVVFYLLNKSTSSLAK